MQPVMMSALLDYMFPDHKGHMTEDALPTLQAWNIIAYTCSCGVPLKLVRADRLSDWTIAPATEGGGQ